MVFHRNGPVAFLTLLLAIAINASAQSGHSTRGNSGEGEVLSITAYREDPSKGPIKIEDIFLYENGVEQRIGNLTYDPSPSRIVLLVDNSETVPAEVEKLKAAAMEFAYEIFEGDQIFVLAYDEKAEIIQEWTDDAKKLEASMGTFRKQGNPFLFDAIHDTVREVVSPLMPGTRKTAIVVIGDGLDRGSRTPFGNVIAELQDKDVTVYALQLADRTGGAYRRNAPKAGDAIEQLTKGTGGKAFPLDEARAAAKFICDELRKNRYLLSYFPVNTSTYDVRRVFVVGNEGITVRTKAAQPPNVK